MYTQMLLVLVVLAPLCECLGCPSGCYCYRNTISCNRVSSFPDLSGSTGREFSLYGSDISEIPPRAFEGNPNLESITIYNAQIGRIRNCAFKELNKNLVSISIYRVKIQTIESGAFSNITSNSSIDIYASTIDTIEPYAFTSLQSSKGFSMYNDKISNMKAFAFHNLNLRSFSLYSSNIKTIETLAFDNFTGVASVSFYLNNITNLQCNTIDNLFADVGTKLSFYSTYLKCDCGLSWLLDTSMSFPSTIKCWAPTPLYKKPVRQLNITTICPSGGGNQQCARPEANQPGVCSDDITMTTKSTTATKPPTTTQLTSLPLTTLTTTTLTTTEDVQADEADTGRETTVSTQTQSNSETLNLSKVTIIVLCLVNFM